MRGAGKWQRTRLQRNEKKRVAIYNDCRALDKDISVIYAEKEVPQPQPPVAFGFSNVKPEPIMFDV